MIDPYYGPIFVRGEVVEKTGDTMVIIFRDSSAFWDESDIGRIGEPLTLVRVRDVDQFQVGEKIIAYGHWEGKRTIETYYMQPNRFQPLGIDWKTTFSVLLIVMIGFIIYQVYWKWLLSIIKRRLKN